MACVKLDILNKDTSALKVVYRKGELREKVVQRFMSVDPLASEFPSWTPYHYVFNNPIRFTDPDGMAPQDLILRGDLRSRTGINKFVDQVNAGLGGYASISASSSGRISITYSGAKGTAEQGFLANTLQSAISAEGNVKITIVESSEKVLTGNYELSSIDVDDTAMFGSDGEFETSHGAIAHEVAEQLEKQLVKGLGVKKTMEGYDEAHEGVAMDAGDGANGSEFVSWNPGTTTQKRVDNQEIMNGTYTNTYIKNGKKGTAKVTVLNNNVQNVKQNYEQQ